VKRRKNLGFFIKIFKKKLKTYLANFPTMNLNFFLVFRVFFHKAKSLSISSAISLGLLKRYCFAFNFIVCYSKNI